MKRDQTCRNYLQDMRIIAHEKRSNLQELFALYEANSPRKEIKLSGIICRI